MERKPALKNCSDCPHQNDCQKIGSCVSDINAQYLATGRSRFPRLMTPAQANAAMAATRPFSPISTGGKWCPPAMCSRILKWAANMPR
jgi:hypothetical protein